MTDVEPTPAWEASGRVVSLHRSNGGVPKLPAERVFVSLSGMEGDRQRNRRFHGGPNRALCLYSAERLAALAAEGHPAWPGSMGENVLVTGLPWERVVPGVVLRLGGVEAEVTGYAAPCESIAGSFCDGGFKRVGQKVHPGWSRVYVRILREGEIAQGDVATIRRPPKDEYLLI